MGATSSERSEPSTVNERKGTLVNDFRSSRHAVNASVRAVNGSFRAIALVPVAMALAVAMSAGAPAWAGGDAPAKNHYRGILGPSSKKFKTENGKTLLWAGGGAPTDPDANWYDFTGSPIPPAELQFGIGKDRIRSIDDPLFVDPDDERLIPGARAKGGKPGMTDALPVIGYVIDGDARAYPVGLLDHHELVNDRIGGKPVTVGW